MHGGELRECGQQGAMVEHRVPNSQPFGTDSSGRPFDLPEVAFCMVCERLYSPDPETGTYGTAYQATLYARGKRLQEQIGSGNEAAEQELVLLLQREMEYEYQTGSQRASSYVVLVAVARLGTTVNEADDIHRRVTGQDMASWLEDRI